jgi:HEAT repeat protein
MNMNVTPESVNELLHSDDYGDRLSAVNQMRYLDPAIAFDMMQTAVVDDNSRVRYSAVSQLASLGNYNPSKSLEILRDRIRTDSEADVRAAAADAIGALRLTEAYEDLNYLYHNTNEWLIQFSIVAALGELGDMRAFPLLEEALQSETELVKTAAIGSLGELGDVKAVSLLLNFVSDHDWQIRYRVVQALGRLGGDEAQAALSTLAHDEVTQVAQEAQSYLGAAS